MRKITLLFIACLAVCTTIAQDFSKIAIIGTHYDYDPGVITYGDDDERAAAEWLISQGGTYIGAERIMKPLEEGGVDISQYDALWIHLDRADATDVANFREFQLGDLGNEQVLETIRNYYKNGGNLFLSIHASIYLKDLGRIDIDPDQVSFGEGQGNPDVWFIGATHGTDHGMPVHNHTTDPIYTGLSYEMSVKINGDEYKTYPLIGAGYKEDHNCFWSMTIPANEFANNDEQKILAFQETYNAEVLGTWAHVQDYFGAAIVRWNPTEEYKGKAITVGLAAYEWNQNSNENEYQYNIIRLTRNILKELAPVTTTQHLVLSGEWSEGEFASLDHLLLTSVDLTGITSGLTEKPVSVNLNCLFFVSEDTDISGTNVIKGDEATSISLTDGYAFHNPIEFMAEQVVYQRDFTHMEKEGWASLYIPFPIDDLQGLVVEEFIACDGTTATFETVDKISANTPYIIKIASPEIKVFTNSSTEELISVPVITAEEVQKDNYIFKGTYQSILPGNAEGLYMLKADGSAFAKGSELASVSSFRAYIEYVGGGVENKPLNVKHGGTTGMDIREEAQTKVWSVDRELSVFSDKVQTLPIYSIDGMLVDQLILQEGVNSFTHLQNGIYIINKTKVVIK